MLASERPYQTLGANYGGGFKDLDNSNQSVPKLGNQHHHNQLGTTNPTGKPYYSQPIKLDGISKQQLISHNAQAENGCLPFANGQQQKGECQRPMICKHMPPLRAILTTNPIIPSQLFVWSSDSASVSIKAAI